MGKENVYSLYVSDENRKLLKEVEAVARECNLSANSLIWAAVHLVLPAYKKDLKQKRTITVDGRSVVI